MLPVPAFANSVQSQTVSKSTSDTASSARTAPTYDTDPAVGTFPNGGYNTPEADARPGEYYFRLAVRAFQKKQYKFAIDMYKVAASWAYKPAEYNLGVMYFRGQGVAADRPRGTAWMVLAAERNDPRYAKARNLMVNLLSNAEFARADTLFGQLKPTYGDKVALHRAKVRWAYVRSHMTGSRVGGTAGPLRVGAAGGGSNSPAGGVQGTLSASLEHSDSTGFDITGGQDTDGSIAYRQFRQSNNPYDPKFRNKLAPTTSIGALKQVRRKDTGKTVNKDADTAGNP
ncbi:MAG: sel1 repeat family protein [Rhodanobacter sp.]|nr:MAG: sel1 repeat family protein [Rhodanobacter sp.]